jgi:hypothetical protein
MFAELRVSMMIGTTSRQASREDAMRVKVRRVAPPADTRGLEELVADEPSPPDLRAGELTDAATTMPEHGGRPPAATALGPNGDTVLDILTRAARLTADESRRLEQDSRWRWGFLALATSVLAPAVPSMPVARAVALARGRAEGRSDAIDALNAAVATIMRGGSGARSRAVLSVCVTNAGLAVLVRDLIEPETFDALFGPWREVMHH